MVLGSPDADSTEIFAETVKNGDPTYVGPLAGKALGLPVYHVLESEIKDQADPGVFDTEVGAMEDALPMDELVSTTRRVRES